jgi:hypothetical protein
LEPSFRLCNVCWSGASNDKEPSFSANSILYNRNDHCTYCIGFLNKPGFRKFRELIDKKMKQTGDFYSSETTISDICNWRDDIAFEIRNAFWHREEKYKAFLAIDNPKLASSKEDALEFVKKAYSFLRDLKSNTTKDEIKRDYDHEENERYK